MATLGASGSSNTSRWGRTGEPGSAFSGLSRGRGRGRGGAGGSKGGRRARGGPPTRDSTKAEDDIRGKLDNSQSSTSLSTKSSISSAPVPGKPNVPSSKQKPASRRESHAIPVAAVPQINESVETASASASMPAKLSQKRRRSQAGKPTLHVPPMANPATLNGRPLRSNTLGSSSGSHAETLSDVPLHLNNKFDVRNDIDALVERVRAVAMDNRPSTPRSHIDWAIDDDDTLPDLDDWGVTTLTASQLEAISPIIVDGLRSLPEFAADSTVPSPLKQAEAIMAQSSSDGITPNKALSPSLPSNKEDDMESKFLPEPVAKYDPRIVMPKMELSQPNASQSLHPSLPAKPLSVDCIVRHISKPRPRASPMRIVPHPKSPITDLSGELSAANLEQTDAQDPVEVPAEMIDHKVVTRAPELRLKGPEHLTIVEPAVTEYVMMNVSSDREGPHYTQTTQDSSLFGNAPLSGLGASMHAPKGIIDSVSAPVNLSTYTDSCARDPVHTHTRAHTVGRSPLPDSIIRGQGDYMSRFTRSGHTTPMGGFQGSSHARTHSTPPGGANHHRSPQPSRPIITGDAISRLARTIGKTHNFSPTNSHSALTFGN